MRKVTRGCGVNAETIPEVERSYAQFLALFDTHLESSPYLLGGRPTIADFGFTGPLYAHLARDPDPSLLMKQRAHRVWRWVERMNAPVFDAGEYGDRSQELFADDGIPETLQHLLAYIGEEYAAEAIALVAAIDEWLANHAETQAGDIVGGRPHRARDRDHDVRVAGPPDLDQGDPVPAVPAPAPAGRLRGGGAWSPGRHQGAVCRSGARAAARHSAAPPACAPREPGRLGRGAGAGARRRLAELIGTVEASSCATRDQPPSFDSGSWGGACFALRRKQQPEAGRHASPAVSGRDSVHTGLGYLTADRLILGR